MSWKHCVKETWGLGRILQGIKKAWEPELSINEQNRRHQLPYSSTEKPEVMLEENL